MQYSATELEVLVVLDGQAFTHYLWVDSLIDCAPILDDLKSAAGLCVTTLGIIWSEKNSNRFRLPI